MGNKSTFKIGKRKFYKIPWFEDYYISIHGEIRLVEDPDIIIPIYRSNNRDIVVLQNDKTTMIIQLDRLMMNIFVGKLDYRIIHKDDDRKNHCIKNLTYDINKEDHETKCFAGKCFTQIPGFSRYYISRDGIIYNSYRRNFMRIGYDEQQYQNLHLINDNGKDVHTKIHILLMLTYGPQKPDPKMIVHHKDSIEYHNVLSNLEYVYQYDNIYESFLIGDQKTQLKRTKEDVHIICDLIKNNKSNKEIIRIMGIDDNEYHSYYVALQDIRTKRTWKHISDKYF